MDGFYSRYGDNNLFNLRQHLIIDAGIHYPVPIHLQEAYRFLGFGPGSFPVAERCARELLSLPMYPELRPEQIRCVVDTLKASLCS